MVAFYMFNKSGYVRVKQKDLYCKSECFRLIQEIILNCKMCAAINHKI